MSVLECPQMSVCGLAPCLYESSYNLSGSCQTV